jgi:hypothetical protein
MLVTSTAEVFAPSDSDFICALLNNLSRDTQLAFVQALIPSEFDGRLHPELRFATFALDVNVHAGLFAREEQEPEPLITKYRGTHRFTIPESAFQGTLHYRIITVSLYRDLYNVTCPSLRRQQRLPPTAPHYSSTAHSAPLRRTRR